MKLTISTSGGQTVENAWNLVGNVVWSGGQAEGGPHPHL